MQEIEKDLDVMKQELRRYVNQGRELDFRGETPGPRAIMGLDKRKIKPLRKVSTFTGTVHAVDCGTRTLKRANNWGIYLLRSAYALTRGREVDWGFKESICTVIGDKFQRGSDLRDARVELESRLGLELLHEANEGSYVLLDGPSLFGGKGGFRVSLIRESEKAGINLLAVSKRSPTLHDPRGRDLMAQVSLFASYPIWVYYSVIKANKDAHLYGNVSIVKLCGESSRVFRCDIMEYLSSYEANTLLSPLTFLAEDPRCLGYPVTLYLAHSFTAPSDVKLLHYYTLVEDALKDAGIHDVLRTEEIASNFLDELHGVKRPYERELIETF